ncbi:lipopolysaccharide biosynthesis protein [bacterium]|nr:lipopolysaccharide biosynthesis protein [bacterium]
MKIKDRIIALFQDSEFRAPVLKLLSGQGIAFVIGYIANIILMRMYPDEFWGTVDYIITWTTILIPVVSLRYEDALMLPTDRRQSAHAYLLAVGTTVLFSLGLLGALSFSDTLIQFFRDKDIGMWSLFIPLAIVVHRLAKITELWLTRQTAYNHISAGQIVQVSAMTGVRIGVGLVTVGPGGLLWGFISGYALMFLTYSKRAWTTLKSSLGSRPTLSELGFIAKRYRRFPFFTMPAALLSAMIMKAPFLILLEYLDLGTYGQFSRGFNVLFVPLSLLAGSVAQVFFVQAVKTNREGTLAKFSSNVHGKLVLMGIFPTAVLMVAGADIFEVLFGPEWRASGEFLLYMAPWIMLSIVSSPLTRLFDVLERQRLELVTAIISSAVIIGTLVGVGQTNDAGLVIMALGIAGSVVRMGSIILLMRLSGTNLSNTFKPYLKYVLTVSPILLALWAVSTLENPIYTFIAALIGGLIFAAYILKTERLLAVNR